ncbi:MAG: hypothetical protein IJU23_07300 [Proteobacteria bacterium]|nr:hypothetical protein [Pseudomonadota bacterium]
MGEIVYYDANPTVRDLMASKFARYGMQVCIVQSLKQCEEVFQKCRKPLIFIADLSRHPDYLPMLQTLVPRYIDAPGRCILTSVNPRELAPYLLPNLDDNFFSHVVERPFKTEEFMNFFDDVAKLCPNTTCFVHDKQVSCVNSSVEQITGQNSFIAIDDALASEVEDIFKTTATDSTSGNNTPSRFQNRMGKRDSRPMSAGSRMQETPPRETVSPLREASYDNRRNQPQRLRPILAGRELPPSNRELPPSNRDIPGRGNAVPNRDISPAGLPPKSISSTGLSPKGISPIGRDVPPISRQYGRDSDSQEKLRRGKPYADEPEIVDMTQAILPEDLRNGNALFHEDMTTDNKVLSSENVSKSALDAAGISAMRGFKLSKKEPPVPKMMTIASTFEAPMTAEENSFGSSLSANAGEDELEGSSTMFFTMPPEAFSMPKNENLPGESAFNGIESSIVADEVNVHYAFDIPWLISILRMSLVRQKRYTVVCSKDAQDQIVILIAFGRVEWIERIRNGVLPDVHAFVEMLPQDIVPRHKLTVMMKKKSSMREIFSAPGFMPLESAVSQMITRQMPDILRYFDGCPADVFDNIPAKWAPIGVDRPCLDFKFPCILFDFLRADAESVLTPECFPNSRFGARQFRTPLNADISLTAEETDILNYIRTPRTIAELKAAGKKHVSDILYRLVGFEFADIVC